MTEKEKLVKFTRDLMNKWVLQKYWNGEPCERAINPEELVDQYINEQRNVHLGAAMFCLINLYNTDMNFPELDDRPLKQLEKYKEKTKDRKTKPNVKFSHAFESFIKEEFLTQDSIKTFTLKELVGRTLEITAFDINPLTCKVDKLYFAQDLKSNEIFLLAEEL